MPMVARFIQPVIDAAALRGQELRRYLRSRQALRFLVQPFFKISMVCVFHFLPDRESTDRAAPPEAFPWHETGALSPFQHLISGSRLFPPDSDLHNASV